MIRSVGGAMAVFFLLYSRNVRSCPLPLFTLMLERPGCISKMQNGLVSKNKCR